MQIVALGRRRSGMEARPIFHTLEPVLATASFNDPVVTEAHARRVAA